MEQHLIDGLWTRVHRATEPRGTLLYVHGLGESGVGLEHTMRAAALDRWTHLAPDLPGYGQSVRPDEPLTLRRHADRLAAWARDRADHPVVLVGHSMGGVIGLHLCEQHPTRLRAFVNVEGNVSRGDCGYSGPAAAYDDRAWMTGGFQEAVDRIGRLGVDDAAHRSYHASVQTCEPRAFHLNSRELVEFSEAEVAATRLRRLTATVPLLYIGGRPGGVAARSVDLLEREDVPRTWIEPAGHWPFVDQPDQFVDAVARFLDALPATPA